VDHLTPSPFPGLVARGERSSLALAPSSRTVAGGKAGGQSPRGTLKSGDRSKRIPLATLTSSKKQVDLVNRYTLGTNRRLQNPVDFPPVPAIADNSNLVLAAGQPASASERRSAPKRAS